MHAISAPQLSSHAINFHLHLRHFSPRGFSPRSFSPRGLFPRSFSPRGMLPRSFSPQGMFPPSFSPRGFSPRNFSPRGFPRYFPAVGTASFLILNATWSDFWISSETWSENASAIWNENGTWNESGTWNEIWSANDGCVVIVTRTWNDFLSGIFFALDCRQPIEFSFHSNCYHPTS